VVVHNPLGVNRCVIGVLVAPLALLSFAKYRIGLRSRLPARIWFLSHLILALALSWSATTMWLESTPLVELLAPMLLMRILIFDLPVWLWLVGLVVIRFENRCRLPNTPELKTPL
jgi:hypothetical protein